MKMTESPLTYNIEKDNSCCGLIQLGSFIQNPTTYYARLPNGKWGNKKRPKVPLPEVFAQFEQKLFDFIQDEVADYEHQRGTYGANLTLTEEQLPEFQTYLLSTDWKLVSTWKNQNTTNNINLFHKVFSDEYMSKFKYDSDDDDEDDSGMAWDE